ncbi:hypothetical protein LEP1GSC039_3076 [Leptospira santarosai str. 2000027870]|nr:hypothetical protein LEP1GSC039_3076 [Leptospira santarosai str. 2000027870]
MKQKKDILPMEIEEIPLSLHSPLLDRIYQIARTEGFFK